MTKNSFRLAACVCALFALGLSSPANAQTSRVYFAGYMGLMTFTEMDFNEDTVPIDGDLEMQNGMSFAGAIGLRLSNNIRVELEATYSKNDMNRIDYGPVVGDFNAGGEWRTWHGLANVYYDFDFGWKLEPFIGAGIGLAHHQIEIEDSSGLTPNSSDDALAFAWQLGGGAKYRVRPDLAFTGAYRYLDSTDIDIGSYEVDYGGHEFRIGIEYDLPVQ